MTTATNTTDRELIDAAIAEGKVTKAKPGKARGVNKRTAPMTTTRKTKAQRKADGETPARGTRSTRAKAPKTGITNNKHNMDMKGIVTTVQIAAEQGISAKTLRARIRRNIEDWQPLFKDGVKHMFADNKTTRAKIEALMA